jgi:lysophospholipase L1-like esterase
MKRFLQNTGLVLLSIALCLALAEIAVRSIFPPVPLPGDAGGDPGLARILQFDDKLGFRYQPNASTVVRSPYGEFQVTYRTNELGLRDEGARASADDGALRVLALGNSLVEGWGVAERDRFTNVAETLMADHARPARRVRIFNAGLSGYGAAQDYLLFQELNRTLEPHVVVFFYVGTMVHFDRTYLRDADLDDSGLTTGLSVDAILKGGTNKVNGPQERPPPSATMRALAAHSALVRTVMAALAARAERDRIKAGDPESDLLAGVRAEAGALPRLHEPSLRHVGAIAQLARASNTRFILMHLPLPHQLSPVEWSGRSAYGLDQRVYPAPDRELVQSFCASRKLECLAAHDALKAQVDAQEGEPLFYRYDFHPNRAGNAVIGRWLAEELTQRLQR